MSRSLASFPEELIARILSLALAPRPASNRFPQRHRIAPLLVSKQFLRIASPLLYHSLHLHSPNQARRALDTLTRHPSLVHAVRRVVFSGIWRDSAGVLALCDHVQEVDICLDGGPGDQTGHGNQSDADAETFCHALEQRRTIQHLTIRKDPAVYLTHPRPVYVLQRLAQAVPHLTHLETVHFALRISSSPSTLPLARALSASPRLRSVRAQLPAVWNTLLLVISSNPRLEKVVLYTELTPGPTKIGSAVIKGGFCDDIEPTVSGTGLYMMEARKHARLSDLIKGGTSIIRTRAHTTIATLSTPSAGGTPLGAIRAKEVAVELMGIRDSFGLVAAQTRHAHAVGI